MAWYREHIKLPLSRLVIGEDGAVTIDYVVLSAAVIGLAIAITTGLGASVHDHGERIDDTMVSVGVVAY